VGRIRDKRTLCQERCLEPLGHVVEGACKVADRVVTERHGHARRQVATGHVATGVGHARHRPKTKSREARTAQGC